jgi:TetR/AcrR family transcriptional regulator of autoinduction and epiphytic fitness
MQIQPPVPQPAESADDSPQRRRLPPDERRSEIFQAALAVFSDLGYDRATLSDVVERVGVSKGCLYHHFESKEQLFIELLRDKFTSAVQADEEMVTATAGSRDDVLHALVERIWQHLQEPGQIELTKLAITELPKLPDTARYLFDEVVTRKREMMRKVLERGAPGSEMGQAEVETAAVVIPWMIMGVALGLHLCRGIDPSEISSERVGKAVAGVILQGVGGICAEEPGHPV